MKRLPILLATFILAGLSLQCNKKEKPLSFESMTEDQKMAFRSFGVYPYMVKTSDYGEFPDRV